MADIAPSDVADTAYTVKSTDIVPLTSADGSVIKGVQASQLAAAARSPNNLTVGSNGEYATIADAVAFVNATYATQVSVVSATLELRDEGNPFQSFLTGDLAGFEGRTLWYSNPSILDTDYAVAVISSYEVMNLGGLIPSGGGGAFAATSLDFFEAIYFDIQLQTDEVHLCEGVIMPKFTSIGGDAGKAVLDAGSAAFALQVVGTGCQSRIYNISHTLNGNLYSVQQVGWAAVLLMDNCDNVTVGPVHSTPLFVGITGCTFNAQSGLGITDQVAQLPCGVNGCLENCISNFSYADTALDILHVGNANPEKIRLFEYRNNQFNITVNDSASGVATGLILFNAKFGTSTNGLISFIENTFVISDQQTLAGNEPFTCTVVNNTNVSNTVQLSGNKVIFAPQNAGSTCVLTGGGGINQTDGRNVDTRAFGITSGDAVATPFTL